MITALKQIPETGSYTSSKDVSRIYCRYNLSVLDQHGIEEGFSFLDHCYNGSSVKIRTASGRIALNRGHALRSCFTTVKTHQHVDGGETDGNHRPRKARPRYISKWKL